MADRPHIKAATTTVTVTKSQSDLIALLRRHWCRDFGFDEDPNGTEASVRFRVTTGGRDLPVLMRVNIEAVQQIMPPHTGVIVFAFDFGGGGMSYISNAQREGAIASLKEWIALQERA